MFGETKTVALNHGHPQTYLTLPPRYHYITNLLDTSDQKQSDNLY